MKNLTLLYRSSLQAQTATNRKERKEAFRLRYQVYCLERGFEAPALFDDEIETDDYDDNAIHFLTRYRSTQSVLGVTRLVIDRPEVACALPIESHDIAGVGGELHRLRDAGHRIAEVSRLAVTRDLGSLCRLPGSAAMRGPDQTVSVPAPFSIQPAITRPRIIPQHISMGLLALLFNKSREAGISHWVVLLDAALARCYSRFGIEGKPIGPAIDHRGLRQPLLINLVEVWERIQRRCPPLACLIREFSATTLLGAGFAPAHVKTGPLHSSAALAPLHSLGQRGNAASGMRL